MAPKRPPQSTPTKAESTAFTNKEAHLGGCTKYDLITPSKPSTFAESISSSGSECVDSTQQWMNGAPTILDRVQTPLNMWRSRSLNRSDGSVVPTVKAERYCLRFPLPAPVPPPFNHSPLTTEQKNLLPVLPLDIRIGVDWRQTTGHATAVAAHIDEVPNKDQDEDSELQPRRVVRAVRRRGRFVTPPETISKHSRVETAATLDEMWVAVGEDRCKPCTLVGREVCKPQWNASDPCKSCVFCKGRSWSCKPPGSWLEKVDSSLQERAKTHKVATDNLPFEMGKSSKTETTEAPPKIEATLVRRQSGRLKDRNGTCPVCSIYSRPADQSPATKASSDHDDCNLVIEANAMARTLEDQTLADHEDWKCLMRIDLMLEALCDDAGIDPLLLPGSSDNPAITPNLTHSVDSLPRKTKRKDPFPRLDIAISADRPRGTKRPAPVAAHIDEPNEDEGRDSESESRKSVTPAGRRVRFQSTPVSHPKQRRRITVDDDLETAEVAPDEKWVAVGEDRCKSCKLMAREVCKPQWSARGSCKSCVFCTRKNWSCNPPDSWLEKVASTSHPKGPLAKTYEVVTDDAPIESGGISGTIGSSPPTTEVAGHQKDGRLAQVPLNNDYHLQRMETHPSKVVHRQEGLTSTRKVQQDMRAMLLLFPPPRRFGSSSAIASTTARSMASSQFSSRLLVPISLGQRAVANGQVEREVEGPFQNNGGSSSRSRDTAHAEAGLSGGAPAVPPKESPVDAKRTQGSDNALFLPKVQNYNAEKRLRLVKNSLGAVSKCLEEAQDGLLEITRRLDKITMGIQAMIEILR